MAEAITIIEARRSGIHSGVLHLHHSICNEIELLGSDSHVFPGEYLPPHAIFIKYLESTTM